MSASIGYPLALGCLAAALALAWALSRADRRPPGSRWRGRLLLASILGSAASLALFLAVIFGPHLRSGWVPDIAHYRAVAPLTLAAIVLGFFGRRGPRVLAVAAGCGLTLLWLNLAASSL